MDDSKKNYVYSTKEYSEWWVEDTTDYYYFKTFNIKTKEVKEMILSWSRNMETSDKIIRVYDVEIDGYKYYFNFYYEDGVYKIRPKDNMKLEKLLRITDITFVGKLKNHEES